MLSSPQPIKMAIETAGDLTIVRYEDARILDEIPIMNMGDQLIEIIDKQGCRKMILNFEQVCALSSAAIGKLIHIQKKMVEEHKGTLVICSLKDYLLEPLRLMRLDRRFVIVPDEQAALERF